MAKTNKDFILREQIRNLIDNLKSFDKTDDEIINIVMARFNVCRITAKEHLLRYDTNLKFKQIKFNNCKHEWSNWFCSPYGMARECRLCGVAQSGKLKGEIIVIEPKLDSNGFLK